MTVRAKFSCVEVEASENGGSNIKLEAVVSGSEENEQFFKFTPGGELTMYCVNEDASSQFELGKEYYIDLTPA